MLYLESGLQALSTKRSSLKDRFSETSHALAGMATLFPSQFKFLVPLAVDLSTCNCRWKSLQRCGVMYVLTDDDRLFGRVRVSVSSLHIVRPAAKM